MSLKDKNKLINVIKSNSSPNKRIFLKIFDDYQLKYRKKLTTNVFFIILFQSF